MKLTKETNQKQKFQKSENGNIYLTYFNAEYIGNFHFLSFRCLLQATVWNYFQALCAWFVRLKQGVNDLRLGQQILTCYCGIWYQVIFAVFYLKLTS